MSTTYTLVEGDQQATVSSRGGHIVSYSVGGKDILAGHENPAKPAFRGALLAPWPNRVAAGRWSWQGTEHQLKINDPEAGAALHGLVYDVEWSVVSTSPGAVSLAYDLAPSPGYPFPLHLEVTYALAAHGLSCSVTATNTGAEAAPVGLGFHPYVDAAGLADDLVVSIPARTLLRTDSSWREAGRIPAEDAGLDFTAGRRVGDLELDAAFTDVITDGDGRSEAVVGRPDGVTVTLWSRATCRWWQLFTADTVQAEDRRRSVAVEPMTCPPNALNTGEIDVLQPGGSLRLDWGMEVRRTTP